MTSLLVILLTLQPPYDSGEYRVRQILVESGEPIGNHCLKCAKMNLATRLTFSESGWTCPNGHVGFGTPSNTSHKCTNVNCAISNFNKQ